MFRRVARPTGTQATSQLPATATLRLNDLPYDLTEADCLSALTSVETVELPNGGSGSEICLICFKRMPQIKMLSLAGSMIGDKGLRRLRFLERLEELNVSRSGIRGPGLSALRGMKGLKKLGLHDNPLNAGSLANLEDLAPLEELDLRRDIRH